MNNLSKKDRIQIETLRDCCRTFIWLGQLDKANNCLQLAKQIYVQAMMRYEKQTETLELVA